MNKSVMIPVSTVKMTIELLECLDAADHCKQVWIRRCEILRELIVKMRRLELRSAYSQIVLADNHADKEDALTDYFFQKNNLRRGIDSDPYKNPKYHD